MCRSSELLTAPLTSQQTGKALDVKIILLVFRPYLFKARDLAVSVSCQGITAFGF